MGRARRLGVHAALKERLLTALDLLDSLTADLRVVRAATTADVWPEVGPELMRLARAVVGEESKAVIYLEDDADRAAFL